MSPPFAFFDIAPEKVHAFFMYVLSVIGAFVAGYVGAAILGKLFDRYVLRRKSPEFMHKLLRICTAFAVAIIVAIMLFGFGMGGNGGKPTTGTEDPKAGPPGTTPGGPDPKATPNPNPTPPVTPVPPVADTQKVLEVMTVEIRAGAVEPKGAFYRLEGTDGYLTLDQLDEKVTARAKQVGKDVVLKYKFDATAGKETGPWYKFDAWIADKKLTAQPAQ